MSAASCGPRWTDKANTLMTAFSLVKHKPNALKIKKAKKAVKKTVKKKAAKKKKSG